MSQDETAAVVRSIVQAAREVYTEEGVQIWLHARNGSLGGRTPLELVQQGNGQRVLDLLGALADGVMD